MIPNKRVSHKIIQNRLSAVQTLPLLTPRVTCSHHVEAAALSSDSAYIHHALTNAYDQGLGPSLPVLLMELLQSARPMTLDCALHISKFQERVD